MTKNVFLQFPYLNYINLKEKQTNQLIHIIQGSRLRNDMKFIGFFNMTVNNRIESGLSEQWANFSYNDMNFVKRITNAIGFDIVGQRNNTSFNKLFIMQHQVNKNIYYDYVLVDEQNKKSISHFYKDNDYTSLLTDINICFNRLEVSKKLNHFLKLSNEHNKHTDDLNMNIILRGL